jgi:hypothetical protein
MELNNKGAINEKDCAINMWVARSLLLIPALGYFKYP